MDMADNDRSSRIRQGSAKNARPPSLLLPFFSPPLPLLPFFPPDFALDTGTGEDSAAIRHRSSICRSCLPLLFPLLVSPLLFFFSFFPMTTINGIKHCRPSTCSDGPGRPPPTLSFLSPFPPPPPLSFGCINECRSRLGRVAEGARHA